MNQSNALIFTVAYLITVAFFLIGAVFPHKPVPQYYSILVDQFYITMNDVPHVPSDTPSELILNLK